MAEVHEDVLIDINVQQNQADFQKLGQLNNSIGNIKQAQKQLNEDFKAGKVPIQQYNVEAAKLNTSLKITQAEFSKVQRGITGLKSPFADLKQSIADNAKQVNIAGISYASFLNPVTGTIAAMGALFKLYASSTQGSKDLEFATSQLGAAFNLLGNDLASIVGSKGEDGEGLFSTIVSGIISRFDFATAAVSRNIALIKEELQDLGREITRIQADNNERLAENSVILEKVADSQTSYSEKVHLTGEAIANLRTNEAELLKVKEEELSKLEQLLALDHANENLQQAVLDKNKEISRVKSDTERKVNNILKLESNILDAENKKVEALKKQDDLRKAQSAAVIEGIGNEAGSSLNKLANEELQKREIIASSQAEIDEMIRVSNESEIEEERRLADEAFEIEKTKLEKEKSIAGQRMGLANSVAALFQTIAKDNKALAITALLVTKAFSIAETIANLAVANIKAIAFSPLTLGMPWVGINTGTAIASIATTIAETALGIGQIAAAAGGGKFLTKGPQLILVGDNPGGVERVEVTPVSGIGKTRINKDSKMIEMAGGGELFAGAISSPSMSSLDNDQVFREIRAALREQKIAVVIEDVENLAAQRADIRERANL